MKLRSPLFLFTLIPVMAVASGLERDGITARSMGLGGADTAIARSPLEAMTANPAALVESKRGGLEVSVDGVYLRASLRRDSEEDAHLRNRTNVLGDVALVIPTNTPAVRVGFVVSPDAVLLADWRYRDQEGGLDGLTTYGNTEHRSEFLALRMAAGAGVEFSRWFSAGFSMGLIYNQNSLHAPYIFQTQPVLRGFKTQLDLDTDGWGATGQLGLLFKPADNVRIGLSYTTPTEIHSKGDAIGNASAQLQSLGGGFALVDPNLAYEAEVLTKLPQKISAAVSWQATGRLLLTAQVDWINWSDAFDDLRITLTEGENAVVNSLVGSDSLVDVAPLRWKDQTILRFGLEYTTACHLSFRAGYAWSSNPVPSETLTPLTAALAGHLVTAGLGWQRDRWHWDLAWQWQLPVSETANDTLLSTHEYDGSDVTLESHWIGFTTGVDF